MSTIPKIYRLGDRHTAGIIDGDLVIVEEKYDGSQFSFGVTETTDALAGTHYTLRCWSKNQEINLADPGMFKQAVETAQRLHAEGALNCNWVYQCEYLQKPKHNVLTYARVPQNHLVLFDIRDSLGAYCTRDEKNNQAFLLGLEPVGFIYEGYLSPTREWEAEFLGRESNLGGCKVEGFVIKNYNKQHDERPGHPRTAKIVSEAFKEVKTKQCAHLSKAAQNEAIEKVIYRFRTEARWCKAVQHLREAGKLTESPKDIGLLLKEAWEDLMVEEGEAVAAALFAEFLRPLRVAFTKGFPEWYLAKLENGWTVFEQEELLKKSPAPDAGTGNEKSSEVSGILPEPAGPLPVESI